MDSGLGRTSRTNPNPLEPGWAFRTNRLHLGIISERLVDDPTFVGVHRRKFDGFPCGADSFDHLPNLAKKFRFLFSSIILHIDDDPGGGFVSTGQHPIQKKLQVVDGFAVSADEAGRILHADVEDCIVSTFLIFKGKGKSEVPEHVLEKFASTERGWCCAHRRPHIPPFQRPRLTRSVGLATFSNLGIGWRKLYISCPMERKFCTVQYRDSAELKL